MSLQLLKGDRAVDLSSTEKNSLLQYLGIGGVSPDDVDWEGTDYFYFGFNFGDTWEIRRQSKATGILERTVSSQNGSSYDSAWRDRATLLYATFV